MEEIGEALLYHENSYSGWFTKAGDLDHEKRLSGFASVADLPADRYLLGTPDTVVDQVLELQEAYGFNELIFWARLPGVPWEVARRSLRRISEEVLPRLRKAELRSPSDIVKGAIG